MNRRSLFRRVHILSTAWFMLCAIYTLVYAIRIAGGSWWLIVSLSGHWVILGFLLISFYLSAIYRGLSTVQRDRIEHPLTTNIYYDLFYDTSPVIGSLCGVFASIGSVRDLMVLPAMGSLLMTFAIWILVDPLAGFVEMLFPKSHRHREHRLHQSRQHRRENQKTKGEILSKVTAANESDRHLRRRILLPWAEKLAEMGVLGGGFDFGQETEAIEAGIEVWRIGGVEYMKELHRMIGEICREKDSGSLIQDYVSIWWDGIGDWHSKWLEGEMENIYEQCKVF